MLLRSADSDVVYDRLRLAAAAVSNADAAPHPADGFCRPWVSGNTADMAEVVNCSFGQAAASLIRISLIELP